MFTALLVTSVTGRVQSLANAAQPAEVMYPGEMDGGDGPGVKWCMEHPNAPDCQMHCSPPCDVMGLKAYLKLKYPGEGPSAPAVRWCMDHPDDPDCQGECHPPCTAEYLEIIDPIQPAALEYPGEGPVSPAVQRCIDCPECCGIQPADLKYPGEGTGTPAVEWCLHHPVECGIVPPDLKYPGEGPVSPAVRWCMDHPDDPQCQAHCSPPCVVEGLKNQPVEEQMRYATALMLKYPGEGYGPSGQPSVAYPGQMPATPAVQRCIDCPECCGIQPADLKYPGEGPVSPAVRWCMDHPVACGINPAELKYPGEGYGPSGQPVAYPGQMPAISPAVQHCIDYPADCGIQPAELKYPGERKPSPAIQHCIDYPADCGLEPPQWPPALKQQPVSYPGCPGCAKGLRWPGEPCQEYCHLDDGTRYCCKYSMSNRRRTPRRAL